MGNESSTYGKEKSCIENFGGKKLTEEQHLKDLRVGGRIILKWVFTEWNGSMDCVNLAQNRDRRRAPVNAVISFRVLKNETDFLTS